MKSRHMKHRLFLAVDRLLMGSFRTQLAALIAFTFLIVILGGVLFLATGGIGNFIHAVWWAFLRVTDPGNLSYDINPAHRIVGSVVAISGWIIFGLLISLISTAIQLRLSQLQKGRATNNYSRHIVIFGWSATIFSMLDEFAVIAKEQDIPIVVMSTLPIDEMYSEIKRWCDPETERMVVKPGIRN